MKTYISEIYNLATIFQKWWQIEKKINPAYDAKNYAIRILIEINILSLYLIII